MTSRPVQFATCESVAAVIVHARVVTPEHPVSYGGYREGRPQAMCAVEVAWDTQLSLEVVGCRSCLLAIGDQVRWSGPYERDLAPDGSTLRWSVPAERWPFGPPSFHESGCNLFPRGRRDSRGGQPGGLFCDCAASAADDEGYGEAHTTGADTRLPRTPTGPARGPR